MEAPAHWVDWMRTWGESQDEDLGGGSSHYRAWVEGDTLYFGQEPNLRMRLGFHNHNLVVEINKATQKPWLAKVQVLTQQGQPVEGASVVVYKARIELNHQYVPVDGVAFSRALERLPGNWEESNVDGLKNTLSLSAGMDIHALVQTIPDKYRLRLTAQSALAIERLELSETAARELLGVCKLVRKTREVNLSHLVAALSIGDVLERM